MVQNPLLQLYDFGQSVWLDLIQRSMIVSGELARMIEQDGVRGETTNPAIFERAIRGSTDYDEDIRAMAREGKSTVEIYEALVVKDVRMAADVFRPLYDQEEGLDGFVSLEASPYLAHDAAGTIAEARRLWDMVDRPNLMVKVPGTAEGLTAITELISDGINVNVTLLFGIPRYRQVAEAYIAGLEARDQRGGPLNGVASVASFFISRIDTLVDALLDDIMDMSCAQAQAARELRGQVSIASAKLAYQAYGVVFKSKRFRRLLDHGADPQRLLWASTSTKNPAYSDVKYVEDLIGHSTVTTLPLETLEAYRHHGKPAARLEEGQDEAQRVMEQLKDLGVNIDAVTQQLEDEGVAKFITPFDQLLAAIDAKREAVINA